MSDLKEEVIKKIKTIYDPEIPVNIYDLGLIYKIEVISEDEIILPRNCVLTLKRNISRKYTDKNISLIELEISYNNEEMEDKYCIKKTTIKLKSSESSKLSEVRPFIPLLSELFFKAR